MTETKRLPCNVCSRLSLKTIIDANNGKCIACVKAEEQAEFKKIVEVDESWRVFNAPAFLLRSKNTDYKVSILNSARAIAEVFTEQRLVAIDLVARYENKPEHFYIGISELTDTGRAFVDSRLRKWFENMDKWKSDFPPPVAKYKQSLQLQYEKFKQERS